MIEDEKVENNNVKNEKNIKLDKPETNNDNNKNINDQANNKNTNNQGNNILQSNVIENKYTGNYKNKTNSFWRVFTIFFTLLFKSSSILIYFLLPFVITNQSTANLYIAVILIVLNSIDFWVVKNISGRLLVGLFWKKEFKDNKEIWTFDCKVNEVENNKINSFVFWGSLILFGLFWGLLSIFNLFSFSIEKWISNLISSGLLFVNLFLFLKCSKVQTKRLKNKAKSMIWNQNNKLLNILN